MRAHHRSARDGCHEPERAPLTTCAARPASPRPAWVAALNAIGDPAWIALDEASLLGEAEARTGLDDYGGDTFREALRVLLASIHDESRLHLIGRVLARDEIVNLLENRLRMTSERARHPEIGRLPVARPIFITGLPRTGTSILHELLACDTALRAPRAWEVRHPCATLGTAELDTSARIDATEGLHRIWNAMVPEYPTIHELGATLPVECIMITAHEFRSDQLAATNQATGYAAWLATADLRPAYELHRRFLQLLAWNAPERRWVLKAPSHLAALDALLVVYPDACIVQTHRDPLSVIGSVASTLAATARIRSDAVDEARLASWFGGEACAALLDDATRARERAAGKTARFVDVRYAELMREPIETVANVYDALGMELRSDTRERMRAYLDAKPKGKHGAHAYDLKHTGSDRAVERARFADYQARYGVVSESA